MDKVDFKKQLKHLYQPTHKQAVEVYVPKLNFLMIDGKGNPNTSLDFQDAIEALYNISYGIKMMPKKGVTPNGYFNYVVPPLEGLWNTNDGSKFDYQDKNKLVWTLMIMQPEFVTKDLVSLIIDESKKKKDNPSIKRVRFDTFEEGHCVQIMHIGSYDDEPATFAKMYEFAKENNTELNPASHHEIYISDYRKVSPEKLKTILRLKIK